MAGLRLFIAAHLPVAVHEALAATIGELAQQASPGAVRWVTPDRMHLTLRFLGDMPVTLLDPIGNALDRAAAQSNAFSLRLDKLGTFPNIRKPRVVWAGLAGEINRAQELKSNLDVELAEIGISPEKRSFQPHITLGRVKSKGELPTAEWPARVEQVAFEIGKIDLVQSELRPEGPIYASLASSKLKSI